MSKAQLKKHLLKLTQEEVIDVILELYDARKEAKEISGILYESKR